MIISVPGKQILMGEWAVLELEKPAIVAAINKRIFVKIEESDKLSISIKDFEINDITAEFDNLKLKWNTDNETIKEKLLFSKNAIENAINYLKTYKTFKLSTFGECSGIKINNKYKKIGVGSSAASVVAIISAIFTYFNIDINLPKNKEILFKLSAISHYFAQGKIGTGADIAASTYGGIIEYRRFCQNWLINQIKQKKTIKEIVESKWPYLRINKLEIPDDIIFFVGWTKKSASTKKMINQMNKFKRKNKELYLKHCNKISKLVKDAINSLKSKNKKKFIECIRINETYLSHFGKDANVKIETIKLKKLSEIANKFGGAGKLSGAGGGDCGIGICFDKIAENKIKKEWNKKGIFLLDVKLDENGILIDI